MDEVIEEAGGNRHWRAIERHLNQLPQPLGALRHQQTRRLLQIPHLKQPLLQIPLLQANPSGTHHHLLHRIRELRRQTIPNKTPIADPHQAHPPHPHRLHQPHQTPRLERLRPVVAARRRLPEEEQVRHENIEPGEERPQLLAPLPRGVGAEAVDENQRRLVRSPVPRDPAVHDRAVAEVRRG